AQDGDTLLFYPETYEGGKCHANFFSFGAVPAQQVRPLIPVLQEEYGPDVLLFGADYVWPHRTFEIARPIIEENGGTVVEELYLPLIADDFTELVNAVRETEPDYIFSLYPAIWGAALKALDDAGLLDDVGVGTTFLGDPDLSGVGGLASEDYTALPFFTSVEGDSIDTFLESYADAFGSDAIPSGGESVGSYNAVYMYKAAVEAAGSTDPDAVAEALVGLSFDGPTGSVTMTPSHHLRQTINLVRADDSGSYDFVGSFPDQDPEESCNL
ncbi:MAG: transporter substrate-binding protein, partial [Acidimicrobiales bacterium]